MWSKRYTIANVLVMFGVACTAYASWRSSPAIITPSAALLDGRIFAYSDVVLGRNIADGKLMLSLFLDHHEHLGTPGTYTFPVEQFSGGENISFAQFTRRYKWEMTPNPEVAKWQAVAGEAILIVESERSPSGGYIGSVLLKDLVLQRIGSDKFCKLETFSIDDQKLGWTPRGCGCGFPAHAN